MIDKTALNPARAAYYALFGKLFIFKDTLERYSGLKEMLPHLIENAIDDESANALSRIFGALCENEEDLRREFDELFYLIGAKTVKSTASYYHEGSELGAKQLEVKNLLAQTPFRRDEKHYKEPEDSVGFLFVFMQKLIELNIKGENYAELEKKLFTQIINPFIVTFGNEILIHPKSNFYKSAAVALNSFMEFERVYFDAPYFGAIDTASKLSASEQIELSRRAKNRALKEADKACVANTIGGKL